MKRIAWTKLLFTAALFTGCTTAQVRWDAIGVREQVMKFYNDEIMDNLINMKNDLPYVHVDVSTVSAAAASQLSGSVGGGSTRTFGRPGALKWRAGRFYYIAIAKQIKRPTRISAWLYSSRVEPKQPAPGQARKLNELSTNSRI